MRVCAVRLLNEGRGVKIPISVATEDKPELKPLHFWVITKVEVPEGSPRILHRILRQIFFCGSYRLALAGDFGGTFAKRVVGQVRAAQTL